MVLAVLGVARQRWDVEALPLQCIFVALTLRRRSDQQAAACQKPDMIPRAPIETGTVDGLMFGRRLRNDQTKNIKVCFV